MKKPSGAEKRATRGRAVAKAGRVDPDISASVEDMDFTPRKILRFIRNLEKHGVLDKFVKRATEQGMRVVIRAKSANLAKSLLHEKGAHKVDVFAKSIVGSGSPSPGRTECPHFEE